MKLNRLFSILDFLRQSRRPVTAEALAEKYGVSLRTIYRDMVSLQAMGAPVRGEGGIGYQMERGYFLPPLQFDHDELEALVIGMKMVAARGDDALGDAAKRAGSKIHAVLPPVLQHRFDNNTILAVGGSDRDRSQNLSQLRKVIRSRHYIAITYTDKQDRESRRRLRPLGLTAFETTWLLTAWCELRQDFRNFRLDRITILEQEDALFRRESGKEFSDYLARLTFEERS